MPQEPNRLRRLRQERDKPQTTHKQAYPRDKSKAHHKDDSVDEPWVELFFMALACAHRARSGHGSQPVLCLAPAPISALSRLRFLHPTIVTITAKLRGPSVPGATAADEPCGRCTLGIASCSCFPDPRRHARGASPGERPVRALLIEADPVVQRIPPD